MTGNNIIKNSQFIQKTDPSGENYFLLCLMNPLSKNYYL